MTLSFAPDRIEMWPLARLQRYARNAKAHGADQVAKIAASMAEFGWTVPCLVAEDGELIAGHGRVLGKSALEEVLVGFESMIEGNAVEVYVSRLRGKLGSKVIVTRWGLGYTVP